MTHDELLARLIPTTHYPYGCNDCACGDEFEGFEHHLSEVANKHMNALRAVVELHKPKPSYLFDDEVCYHCSSIDAHTEIIYPCETIQAIKEQLANG